MIIMIVLLSIFVISLILRLIPWNPDVGSSVFDLHEWSAIVGWINFSILIVLSILSIIENCPSTNEKYRYYYNNTIEELNNTYNTLKYEEYRYEEYYSSFIISVSDYNNNVKDFKVELQQNKILCNNVWISWLCNQIANEFDIDSVQYYILSK